MARSNNGTLEGNQLSVSSLGRASVSSAQYNATQAHSRGVQCVSATPRALAANTLICMLRPQAIAQVVGSREECTLRRLCGGTDRRHQIMNQVLPCAALKISCRNETEAQRAQVTEPWVNSPPESRNVQRRFCQSPWLSFQPSLPCSCFSNNLIEKVRIFDEFRSCFRSALNKTSCCVKPLLC